MQNDIEKAIEILSDNNQIVTIEVLKLSIQALQEKQEREKNELLTLEQLKLMCEAQPHKIYEPVWIMTLPNKQISCQLTSGLIKADYRYKNPKKWIDAHTVNLLLEDYGKSWLAYRHKPPEVTE